MSFIHAPDVAFSEIRERATAESNLLSFGIKFLDEATEGILKNDLILIGARSGAGKTQLCTNVAWSNVQNKKRVHYIALEAEHLEIEQRIKYRIFCKYFFQNKPKCSYRLSFKNWKLGRMMAECAQEESLAAAEFEEKSKGFFSFYKTDKFDVSTFINTVLYCSGDTDLIIVDHVHYFDYEDQNENRAVKEIATVARDLALRSSIPIILVAHLRKGDRFSSEACPGLEDFHGSSDLYKIATKAITLSAGNNYSPDGRSETFMRIVKDRFDSSITKHMASLTFDTRTGGYEDEYKLGSEDQKRGNQFEEYAASDYPPWSSAQAGASGNTFDGNRSLGNQGHKEIQNHARSNRAAYKDD